jgi:putative chitinase
MLTEKQLAEIFPRNRHLKRWMHPLADTLRDFQIDTPLRIAHFFAQIAEESEELMWVEEKLHYSPQRLVQVWPKHFPDINAAVRYARNPEKLANRVYAGRNGNGIEASQDGWRFRGRGLIQISGRANYAMIGEVLKENLLNTPDMLLQPKWAALSAGAFWKRNGLNELADKDDVVAVTKKVNGGTHGLEERKAYLIKAKEVLHVDSDWDSETDQDDSPGLNGAPTGQKSPSQEAPGWFD